MNPPPRPISPPAPYLPLEQTLEDAIVIDGIGLHGGRPARVFLRPAPAGRGIRFRRVDLPGHPEIPALTTHVSRTRLQTTLKLGDAEVFTVEHLLSALVALGIDNAWIDVDGDEIPIFDGSAGPFVRMIRDVGTALLPVEKSVWVPRRTVRVDEGDKWIQIEPHDRLIVDFTIVYDNPIIGTQRYVYDHDATAYERDIAQARTFGLEADVARMRAAGYALGGDFDNAVVVGDTGVLNPDGLRYPDEFVRHKILDVLGDLGLVGGSLLGRVTAMKSGHTLNRALADRLVEDHVLERRTWRDTSAVATPLARVAAR